MKWRSLDESAQVADFRPLRDILAERKENIAHYAPPETQAVHAAAVAALKSRNLAANVLPVGALAPSFELSDHNGKLVRSTDLLHSGPLVVCFIRGRWCPFCVGQMEAMNQIAPQLKSAGASLVAISPQTVKQSSFMQDQHKLRFPLLSDAHNTVAKQFHLVYRVPAEQAALYRRTFINLPNSNGDDSWELPVPATFVINRSGVVAHAFANEDYTERPEPLAILAALEKPVN